MELEIVKQLTSANLLSPIQEQRIADHHKNKLFSLHWELRTILFVGISLFTSGIGILVYNNIDTIGHQTIIGLIALMCGGCFLYCFKHGLPYSNNRVERPSPFFDYVLLLGCLLFVTLETYLQFQYTVFGDLYNLASLLPAAHFIFLAYKFDNKGILSMAITAVASTIGLTVTPLDLIDGNDFSSDSLIYTSIVFAILMCICARLLYNKDIKKHFTFTYYNFATNIAFVATLAGLFDTDYRLVFFILLLLFAFAGYRYAKLEKSPYFLLISIIYAYIGLSYFSFYILDQISYSFWDNGGFFLVMLYFGGTCFGIIQLFRKYRKILNITE